MINALIYDAPVKKMTLKTLHVLPALVLYQPSKNSKSKGHKRLFERRFDIWKKLDNKKKKNEHGNLTSDRQNTSVIGSETS